MFMASIREIKRRRESIQSTAQITKAMKLVSTVKYQKAKVQAEAARPYFEKMYETMISILSRTGTMGEAGEASGSSPNSAVIVLTGNRGLAGGYNANIIRMVLDCGLPKEQVKLYTIGSKGREALEKKGYTVFKDYSEMIEAPSYHQARQIMSDILEAYHKDEFSSIYLVYTYFKNTMTHIPKMIKLLPAEKPEISDEEKQKASAPMNFEPDEQEVLDALIPNYITSLVYGAVLEAYASENGARMTAMDSATSNAEEMIDDLELKYNRARQGSITQEITEIVAGTESMA